MTKIQEALLSFWPYTAVQYSVKMKQRSPGRTPKKHQLIPAQLTNLQTTQKEKQHVCSTVQ